MEGKNLLLAMVFAVMVMTSVAMADFTVTLGTPSNNSWNTSATNRNFTFTVTGDNATYNASLWGNFSGTWAENTTINVANNTLSGINITIHEGDGIYLWNIRADNGTVDNWSTTGNFTLKVDATAPVCTYSSATPSDDTEYMDGDTVTIGLTVTENNPPSTCTLYWDGNAESVTLSSSACSTTKTVLNDVEYYYSTITDSAGNSCSAQSKRHIRMQGRPSGEKETIIIYTETTTPVSTGPLYIPFISEFIGFFSGLFGGLADLIGSLI